MVDEEIFEGGSGTGKSCQEKASLLQKTLIFLNVCLKEYFQNFQGKEWPWIHLKI